MPGRGRCPARGGERRDLAQQAQGVLRVGELHRPNLRKRIDAHDHGSAPRRRLERREHAGMVAARVLSDHENGIGLFEILELHRSLADADDLLERRSARLVAHVRTVGQVVSPEGSREELKEKCRFVARPAGRVEHGLIGRGQSAQLARDQRKCLVVGNGLVASRTRAQNHGVR